MSKNNFFIVLIFSILLLVSCNKEPLISEEYQLMYVYIGEELVYQTEEESVIEETKHKINTSRRETTHEWEVPAFIGSIVFRNTDSELKVNLHEGGDVTIDEYYVYTEFDFYK
ncbi:hypothetical protein ACFVR1_19305 [Psychrobacillus sp. NPDC058041]|uniref:hypothetical protein n=1 Tax=Psychrobacillus sp. NPDC058041 TaxID=3346310 RepID=UPI0036DDF1EE